MLDDPSKSVKNAAFSQVRRGPNVDGYTVRSGRWRYTEWAGGEKGAQLFDEEGDPAETKNLAADPAHAETVAEMKKLLEGVRTKP